MRSSIGILAVLFVFISQDAACQAQVTLQQPVFSQFSISTTVSVPDRGWVHLGGVKRALSSRSQYGFFQPGSSIGFSRTYTGMSAGVTIIDLAEMDRMILGYDLSMMPHGYYPAPARPTQQQLKQQRLQLTKSRKPGLASAWFKLGKKAEERGRLDRARDCYKRAQANGSTDATTRLATLARPKPLPIVAKKASAGSAKSGPKLLPPTAP